MTFINHYEILEIEANADLSAIKSATEKVSELSQQLGAALYAANAASAEAPQSDDGVQDAEIVEESK